jgi:histidine phosphotransfer protein HptB
MTPNPFDLHTFEALQANAGADFVVTLVDAFAEVTPKLIADLRSTSDSGDAERFKTAAHTLKSNSAAFGATHLAEMARQLEWHGPSADSGALEAIALEVDKTLVALRAMARQ